MPSRLTVTVSPIGPGAERAHFLGRTIRLQLQWADPSPKRRLSRIINLSTFGIGPTASCAPMKYWEIIADKLSAAGWSVASLAIRHLVDVQQKLNCGAQGLIKGRTR